MIGTLAEPNVDVRFLPATSDDPIAPSVVSASAAGFEVHLVDWSGPSSPTTAAIRAGVLPWGERSSADHPLA